MAEPKRKPKKIEFTFDERSLATDDEIADRAFEKKTETAEDGMHTIKLSDMSELELCKGKAAALSRQFERLDDYIRVRELDKRGELTTDIILARLSELELKNEALQRYSDFYEKCLSMAGLPDAPQSTATDNLILMYIGRGYDNGGNE